MHRPAERGASVFVKRRVGVEGLLPQYIRLNTKWSGFDLNSGDSNQ